MAGGTGRTDSTIGRTAEISAMTEGAHGHEPGCSYIPMSISTIIPVGIVPRANRRMSSQVVVTGLTADAATAYYTNIEARVDTDFGVGVAELAVSYAIGEGGCQALSRRTVTCGKEKGRTHRVGGRNAGIKVFQFNRQTGIRKLMLKIVGMTGSVTARISLVVAGAGIHIEKTVPVIADGIAGLVEQQVLCRNSKTTARIGFLHAVAQNTSIMLGNISNTAVIHPGIGGNIGHAVRWIPMTESAVQGKGGCRIMAAETTVADPVNAVKACTMTKGAAILDIAC